MPTNYVAIWSAVIASFAALIAFLMMLISWRNRLESVRPELVLLDWTRFEEGEGNIRHEIISFRKIRNAGRGTAFNVLVGDTKTDEFPTIHIPYFRTDVIAANEAVEVDGRVIVYWKNRTQKEGDAYKHANIMIPISFADSSGVMYFTEFSSTAQ
jgi:hypothetical protein